jgi:hypothetical protein
MVPLLALLGRSGARLRQAYGAASSRPTKSAPFGIHRQSLLTSHFSPLTKPAVSAVLFRFYRFEIVLGAVFDRDDHGGLIGISLRIDRDTAGYPWEIFGAGDGVA